MHLLIAAAGSGRRMGADRNKLLLPLLERPLLAWTLEAALQAEAIAWIGIVGQVGDREAIADITRCGGATGRIQADLLDRRRSHPSGVGLAWPGGVAVGCGACADP